MVDPIDGLGRRVGKSLINKLSRTERFQFCPDSARALLL